MKTQFLAIAAVVSNILSFAVGCGNRPPLTPPAAPPEKASTASEAETAAAIAETATAKAAQAEILRREMRYQQKESKPHYQKWSEAKQLLEFPASPLDPDEKERLSFTIDHSLSEAESHTKAALQIKAQIEAITGTPEQF